MYLSMSMEYFAKILKIFMIKDIYEIIFSHFNLLFEDLFIFFQ